MYKIIVMLLVAQYTGTCILRTGRSHRVHQPCMVQAAAWADSQTGSFSSMKRGRRNTFIDVPSLGLLQSHPKIQQFGQHQYHSRDTLNCRPKGHPSSSSSIRSFATNEIDITLTNPSSSTDHDTEFDRGPWNIPASIHIPEQRIGIRFVRSSGAGGQNVNKVSSCVQLRFHVLSADWMGPIEVRERFKEKYKNQISYDGLYRIESQVYRTQTENRKDVFKKLEKAVLAIYPRPKERKVRVGLTEYGERKRKEEKMKLKAKKESRRNHRYDY